MKTIKLSQGKMALVDDADFEWLNQWKWYAVLNRGNFYAFRNVRTAIGQTIVQMHRQVLGLCHGDSKHCDHKNHNTLDNQRLNIRMCTNQQNAYNRKPFVGGTSVHKGVSWDKSTGKWVVMIQYDGSRHNLGRFVNEDDAANAYNSAASKFFGDFAYKHVG